MHYKHVYQAVIEEKYDSVGYLSLLRNMYPQADLLHLII